VLEGLLPERSAEDIFAGRVRLTLGGKPFDLETLVIEDEEAWLATVEASPLSPLFGTISAEPEELMRIMAGAQASDLLIDLLLAYDKAGVLPPKAEIRKTARPIEVVRSVLEVWQAAHPLLGISLLGMQEMTNQIQSLTNGRSPAATNSPPRATAGRRGRSAKN
jgi:hypothetical protein